MSTGNQEYNLNSYDDHKITISELCARLETDEIHGLTWEEARIRFDRYGPNTLPPPKKTLEFIRFLKALFVGFSGLLWVGAIFAFVVFAVDFWGSKNDNYENLGLAGVLLLVVVVTGGFSFYQEGKSDKVMQSFLALIADQAQVIRSGKAVNVMARDLVIGDVLVITLGDKISADVRIIESQSLKTDHSTLTGESEPLERGIKCTHDDPMETSNMAFFGTYVVEGKGKGIVVRTGEKTFMGFTASLTKNIKSRPTIMAQEIGHFILILAIYSLCMGLLFFAIMMGIGYSWQQGLIFFIGIIIANVPEGLMPTLTLSLTLASQRMAARNCLVKKLEAVESLGNTTIICTDKTGTLTQNVMSVTHFWYNNRFFDRRLIARNSLKSNSVCFTALARCATLCSQAEFKLAEHGRRSRSLSVGKREVVGDASETAILKCPEIASEWEINAIRDAHPKIFQIPFNSYDKFQLSVHEIDDSGHILVMKGAPEGIIPRCSTILLEKGSILMTEELVKKVLNACNLLATSGERVLAFCDKESIQFQLENFKVPKGGLRFLGLISVQDPPRPNVPESILVCRNAGIKIIMVTGDHQATAQAIAKQVHIISDYSIVQNGLREKNNKANAIVLQGSDLQKMKKPEIDEVISTYDELVFARTNPEQKLIIVESCQRLGAIVAVTGDGVNDAPALKKADIGVAMGLKGSAVAKQSANIVLLDDNFATLAAGVEEGRTVFENLKKSIGYTLSHTLPELLLLLAHVLFGIPLPMSVITMLCIDVGTDMWTSIAFAHEPAEQDLMKTKPRDVKNDRLVSVNLLFLAAQIGFVESSAGLFAYFIVMSQCGWLPKDLLGIKKEWMDESLILKDSFERDWNEKDRKTLEYTCYSAVLAAVAISQVANVLVFKSSRTSTFQCRRCNENLVVGVLFAMVIVCFVSYVPGISRLFRMRGLKAQWWLPALPFAAFIIVYDEIRKLFIRKWPNGWVARNLKP